MLRWVTPSLGHVLRTVGISTHLAKSNQWSKPQPAAGTAGGSGRGRGLRHTAPGFPRAEPQAALHLAVRFSCMMKQTALPELHFARWNANKLRLETSAGDCRFWWIWTASHNSALNLPNPVNIGSWTSPSYCAWFPLGSQGTWQLVFSVSSVRLAGFN